MIKTPQRPPVEVGIRDLRDHLSAWLDRVGGGEEVVVTDRGKPVARITPVGGRRALDRLIAQGIVTPASRPRAPVPPAGRFPLRDGTVADLVHEQRG